MGDGVFLAGFFVYLGIKNAQTLASSRKISNSLADNLPIIAR
jgi:hypothetical protein